MSALKIVQQVRKNGKGTQKDRLRRAQENRKESTKLSEGQRKIDKGLQQKISRKTQNLQKYR